jgi:hypothetical protein
LFSTRGKTKTSCTIHTHSSHHDKPSFWTSKRIRSLHSVFLLLVVPFTSRRRWYLALPDRPGIGFDGVGAIVRPPPPNILLLLCPAAAGVRKSACLPVSAEHAGRTTGLPRRDFRRGTGTGQGLRFRWGLLRSPTAQQLKKRGKRAVRASKSKKKQEDRQQARKIAC